MSADVATTLASWSTTAASNAPSGSTAISTNLDDNLRQIQAVVRTLAAADTIASATTTDLSTKDNTFLTISGTTTITGLGTLAAGLYKYCVFSGALTLTHNASSLILPGAANITTAAGDTAFFLSLGSGNWRCLSYTRASGLPIASGVSLDAIADAAAAGTVDAAAYGQTWRWQLTGAGSAMKFTESAASTGGSNNQYLVDIATLSTSTMNPLKIGCRGSTLVTVSASGTITYTGIAASASEGASWYVTGGAGASTYGGGTIDMRGGAATGTGHAGGNVTLSGGSASDTAGDGGAARIFSGGTATGTAGAITLTAGAATAGSGAGGSITLTAGSANNGAGGSVNLVAASSTAGTKGDVNLKAGASAAVVARIKGSDTHLYTVSAAPTISAGGGTGGAIAGSDQAFVVTAGTGSPTSVTVDFATAWGTAPVVVATSSQSGQVLHIAAVSTTQVQISSSSAFNSGTKIYAIVAGYANA